MFKMLINDSFDFYVSNRTREIRHLWGLIPFIGTTYRHWEKPEKWFPWAVMSGIIVTMCCV